METITRHSKQHNAKRRNKYQNHAWQGWWDLQTGAKNLNAQDGEYAKTSLKCKQRDGNPKK